MGRNDEEFNADFWFQMNEEMDEAWQAANAFFFHPGEESMVIEDAELNEQLVRYVRPFCSLAQYQVMSVKEVEVKQLPYQNRSRVYCSLCRSYGEIV